MTAFDSLPEMWTAIADTISAGPGGVWAHEWGGWFCASVTVADSDGSLLVTFLAKDHNETDEEEFTFVCPYPEDTFEGFVACIADARMRRSFVDRTGLSVSSGSSFLIRFMHTSNGVDFGALRQLLILAFPSVPWTWGGNIGNGRYNVKVVANEQSYTYVDAGFPSGSHSYYVTGNRNVAELPITAWYAEYPPDTPNTLIWDEEDMTLAMRAIWQFPSANTLNFASSDITMINLVSEALYQTATPAGYAATHRGGLKLTVTGVPVVDLPEVTGTADNAMRRLAVALQVAYGGDLIIRPQSGGGMAALRRGVITGA